MENSLNSAEIAPEFLSKTVVVQTGRRVADNPGVRRTPQRLLALAFLFAAGIGFTLLPAAPRAHADNICNPDSSWGTVNSGYAAQVLSLVNQHRASLGLGQLSSDAALSRSAVWKSMNMAGLNYFDHNDDPIGRSVGQRLADCGWPSNLGWGENIAYGYGTPDQVMSGWLNSPGHKANIENPSFTSSGVGVAANAQGDSRIIVPSALASHH